jgi:hypothetical protein
MHGAMGGTHGGQGSHGQGMHAAAGGSHGMGQGMQGMDMHGGMGGMHGTGQGTRGMGGMHGTGQGTHGPGGPGGMHGSVDSTVPTLPGQAAFGAVQEIVRALEADPTTDWSKVNIAALREHLIDMNEVTLRATAEEVARTDGIEIKVTGQGRTLAAIKRMVPAHVAELAATGWNAKTEDMPNGVKITVTSDDPKQVAKLKALGFIGILVQGAHHQPHHLAMAQGAFTRH